SPAPRADGWQFATRGMTDEKNERSLRWLLQHFQQCICPFTLKIVDRINNGDAPSPLTRGRAEKRYCAANVVNPNDRIKLVRLLMEGPLEHQQIALCLGGDAARDGMIGIHRKRCSVLDSRRLRVGVGQHKACHAIRQGGLADTWRTADQPCMCNAVTL